MDSSLQPQLRFPSSRLQCESDLACCAPKLTSIEKEEEEKESSFKLFKNKKKSFAAKKCHM
jgi:hypothetical protein